jgi:hypothetical protein
MTRSNGLTNDASNDTAKRTDNGSANGYTNGANFDVEKLAVSPNQPTQIAALLGQLNVDGKEYLETNPQARLKMLETARSLVYALETPREAIVRHCWSEVCFFATLRKNSPPRKANMNDRSIVY